MDLAFFHAAHTGAFPPGPVVLGTRLLPITFGHWRALLRFVPAYVDKDFDIGSAVLPVGVFICSRPAAQAVKELHKINK